MPPYNFSPSERKPPLPPLRTKSHKTRILALLKERGSRGVLASELYDQPMIYGRSPRNRISELRQAGYNILGEARGASDWRYWFVPDIPESEPEEKGRTGFAVSEAIQKLPDDLPLFSGLRRER